eukprot:Opistho-2@35592
MTGFLAQNRRMDPPADCPPSVQVIMETCWRKLPETRPSFAQVVVQLRRAMAAFFRNRDSRLGSTDPPGHVIRRETPTGDTNMVSVPEKDVYDNGPEVYLETHSALGTTSPIF